jgi:hypothetical protein
MAYTGGIDYLGVGFGQLEWEDVKSPWSSDPKAAIRTDSLDGKPTLTAMAYEYNTPITPEGKEWLLVRDTPGGSKQEKMYCVVLGKQKEKEYQSLDQRVHYLLLVVQVNTMTRDGNKIFERVGVGHLPGRCIEEKGFMVSIY